MNSTTKEIIRCYACTRKAISREHVPAKCFFPVGFRNNLQTVPSCKKHNHDNSKDVEYVRDIITSCFQVNEIGIKQFESKSFKSVIRDTKLIKKLFNKVAPAYINGKKTGSIEIDLDSFYKVLNLIGKALYFYDFKKRFTHKFRIFPAAFFFNYSASQDDKHEYFNMLNDMNSLVYKEIKTDNPKVFKYYIYTELNIIVYKIILYEGFVVFLVYIK